MIEEYKGNQSKHNILDNLAAFLFVLEMVIDFLVLHQGFGLSTDYFLLDDIGYVLVFILVVVLCFLLGKVVALVIYGMKRPYLQRDRIFAYFLFVLSLLFWAVFIFILMTVHDEGDIGVVIFVLPFLLRPFVVWIFIKGINISMKSK